MSAVRIVLTDLDGVIRRWPDSLLDSVEDTYGLARGSLARAAFDKTVLSDAITGRVTDSEWRKRVVGRLASQTDPATAAAAVAAWSSSPGVVDTAALRVLQTARSVAALGLVTNATTRLDDDLSRLGLDDAFDCIVNSSDIGCAKPSRCFFEHAAQRCGCDRTEVIFVDDRAENVDAAIEFGYRGHRYRDVDAGTSVARMRRDSRGAIKVAQPHRPLASRRRSASGRDPAMGGCRVRVAALSAGAQRLQSQPVARATARQICRILPSVTRPMNWCKRALSTVCR